VVYYASEKCELNRYFCNHSLKLLCPSSVMILNKIVHQICNFKASSVEHSSKH
jgi:hypothetical protein